jgi:serine/threonine protein kinase
MSVTAPPAVTHNALPPGLRLGEFEIRSVIGEGGFGIVYHAFDHALERDVAIKEYMPCAMAARSATMQVSVLSQGHVETFSLGLRSFVNEARLLARFDHPSLVKVHRFWEGNGTAYMVMPLYRGRTLKALRQGLSASPSESWLRGLVEPLLGALEALHKEGVFHRDIAPDNILVGDDGRPVLLDFGAARRVIGDQSQSLTAILKPNFAPIEQYGEAEGLRQGPWTDLYALGATLYFTIAGQPPQPATARALGAELNPLASVARRGVSAEFLQTVDWMMAPRPEARPQSVAALRAVLNGLAPAAEPEAPTRAARDQAWQHTLAHEPDDEAALPAMHALRPWSLPALRRRGCSRR